MMRIRLVRCSAGDPGYGRWHARIELLDRVAPLVHQLALAWAELAATNEEEAENN